MLDGSDSFARDDGEVATNYELGWGRNRALFGGRDWL